MHYLSLTTIFKMENYWLEEWLNHHYARGVEHFYLYNNDDCPNESFKLIEPYVRYGIATHIPVSGVLEPVVAYKHAISQFSKATYWMGMLDVDEFLLPRQHDDLREVLREYENYDALAIHWLFFGSNGFLKRPHNQIDHFLRRAEDSFAENRFFKSIVKPDHVIEKNINNSHLFPTVHGKTVNENHRPIAGLDDDFTGSKIRINHYCVRSRQDYVESKPFCERIIAENHTRETFRQRYDRNEVFDDEISRRFGYFNDSFLKAERKHYAMWKTCQSADPTVFLTGSITQNYPFLMGTGVQSSEERLEDYLCAISCWLEQPDVEQVVYCDGSGFILPDEVFQNGKFISLALDLTGLCLERGKGAAEIFCMEYAMQHRRFPTENFFKCTGRLFIKNFSDVWHKMKTPEPCFYVRKYHDTKWADTRFFWVNRKIHHEQLRPHLHEMNDYGGPFTEHVYYRYADTSIALPEVVFQGRSAHSGKIYDIDYTPALREKAKILIRKFGLLAMIPNYWSAKII